MADLPPGPLRVLPPAGSPDAAPRRADDLAALLAMARQGSLTGAHRILTARGDTLRADAIPALAAALERDPWSAWEEAEEPPPQPAPPPAPKAADVFSLGVEESTALQELPSHAIMPVAPLSPPPAAPTRLVLHARPDPRAASLPRPAAIEPVAPAPPPSPPRSAIPLTRRAPTAEASPLELPPEGGQVIAFPTRSPPTYGSAALKPLELPELRSRPQADEGEGADAPVTRWGRLGLVAVVLLGGMLGLRWWIRATSTQVFPLAEVPVATTPLEARPVPEAASVYDALEGELRGLLPAEVREIKAAGDLEEALIIELSRMKVSTSRVEAPVLEWEGRKDDVPKVAQVHLWVRSRPGELDREIAAIGMVVGKYINTYTLELLAFEVTFEGLGETPLRRALDPQGARYFYRRNLSLYDFLLGKPADPTQNRPPGKLPGAQPPP